MFIKGGAVRRVTFSGCRCQAGTYGAAGSGRLFLMGSAMATIILLTRGRFLRWSGCESGYDKVDRRGDAEGEVVKIQKRWRVRGFPCAKKC